MNPPETEAFWHFSQESYDRPGVAALCLTLQDRDGRDVNILLLALYSGTLLGRRLGVEAFIDLEAAVAPWRDHVTLARRAPRRGLKVWGENADAAALRRVVQAAELDSERLAQRLLLAALPEGPAEAPSPALGRANLFHYGGDEAAALADLI